MIWKLLRKNISIGQIAGYAIANFIGLTIVLCAIRFYGDVQGAFQDPGGDDGIISADYLVISKPVSTLNVLGKSSDFSEKEINDLKSQPWVSDVGAFTAADFNVTAAVELGGRGIQSFMFLESIPDEFIDIRPSDWTFDESAGTMGEVPIIISKDYLALYNFGLAPSRGLPQISEGLISQVPILLQMSGNGRIDVYRARIVGFSSRLNTIAVPENFMKWANERYSSSAAAAPSRLIVKVNKPGDPQIAEYMDRKGYEVAGDKLDTGRASFFLTLLTSIVISVGVIISALALFILMLSIYLLMQKNREKISNLMLLGYSPRQVAMGYYRLIAAVNAAVLIGGIGAMLILSRMWEAQLVQLDLVAASPVRAIIWAVVIMAAITAINFAAISRSVRRAWK